MELFTDTIAAIREFMEQAGPGRSWGAEDGRVWPKGGPRNIVLKEELGLELGSPDKDSVSCLLWTHDLEKINDGRITLVGSDFYESSGKSLPFGKVVIAGVEGFSEDNAYERHKDMDFLRYSLDLKGFMLRAVSQFMREWCRISIGALREGFSAHILGSALSALFSSQPYVRAVEIIYITSSTGDVGRLKAITAPAEKIVAAMNKMAEEMDFECDTCDYQKICDEAGELKAMREKLIQKRRENQRD